MPDSSRKPLWFTFGNHMHWVDMQWLWGYQVLPDSIDDMLALCDAVGAKGNVNFDGVGYEKLASEDPGALARLRAAVQDGRVEVVGATYGQPYGLFCGGESNARQRVFGARTVRRLLGVWPRTFWEEEFDFFPQLPQLLSGAGFTGACLFYQWTWHTPAVPLEDAPLVIWEGADGTRLPTIAKTALCLHQWPEDFDGKLELALATDRPALVQWLELMPSPDWMCRSEVLLPRLRALFADPRFDVRPATLGGLIEGLDDGTAPVRRYTMDDVFHGMTIGKNGDAVPRRSDAVEARVLAAESLAATLGLCGRPYASWDVHPAWELDEAWRELLQAQHHDNHECEALCGSVGKNSFDRAAGLATDVLSRCVTHVARHVAVGGDDALVVHNPLGWPRDVFVAQSLAQELWGDDGPGRVARAVPAFGWSVIRRRDAAEAVRVAAEESSGAIALRAGALRVVVDRASGRIRELAGADTRHELDAGALGAVLGGAPFAFGAPAVTLVEVLAEPAVSIRYAGEEHDVELRVRLRPECGGVELRTLVDRLPRPDGGFGGALRLGLWLDGELELRCDTPFAVDRVLARAEHVRKYPSGDWMTSPQWFETVRGAFTARSFVDLLRGDGSGLLCVHDGSQGWLRTTDGVEVVLNAYDPWDEGAWQEELWSELVLVPHGPGLSDAARHRRAAEVRALEIEEVAAGDGARLPGRFGGLVCDAPGVVVTAFHREHRRAFEDVPDAFGPAVRNPYVVRLVEYDGAPADVALRVPGACTSAARTDLLGSVEQALTAEPCAAPDWSPPGLVWSALRFRMRPREIATIMLDLELGRHAPRNLDDHRHVWATVHRR